MKMMRALLFVVVLLFALAGCSSGKEIVSSETLAGQVAEPTNTADSAVGTLETPNAKEQPSDDPTEPAPSSSAVASPSSSSEPSQQAKDPGASKNATGAKDAEAPSASPSPKEMQEPAVATPAVDSITLSIVGNAEWGTVLAAESVILDNGDTAASALKRTAKAHRLSYEFRGSGAMTYIAGIDGLFEFDDGPLSGWKYRVNGVVPDVGAGSYELKAGDRLEWFYTSEDDAAKEDKESES